MSIHHPLTLTLRALDYYKESTVKHRSVKMDDMLSEMFEKNNVNPRDRRIAYARTMDVIRRWEWAKKLVDSHLSRKCPSDIYNLLLLGTTELCYPPRPAQVTINQICNYAKKFHPKFGSFVYGVLKNIERLTPIAPQKHCPEWMLELLRYSEAENDNILEAWMHPPKLFIRSNNWRISKNDFHSLLLEADINCEQTPLGWYIYSPVAVTELPGYQEGLFYVQDENAAMVDFWFEKIQGRLWDACAAPGGKTLASLAFKNIITHASDNQAKRLRTLQHNLKRAQPSYLPTVSQTDATQVTSTEKWDAILLDVPCSGSGVFSKHPEKKWTFTQESLSSLLNTQALLLESAWQQLEDQGEILYMTCSLFTCENQEQILKFIEKHQGATLLPVFSTESNEIGDTLFPQVGHSGGFYLARIKKGA